jgi:ATP-dependent helicase/nuclease subunit B
VEATFVLGPSGSGKTHRCLAEVRAALLAEPDGPPLVFLAPKQATFQLERDLLADPALPGWTRLHILSFERLAEWVLDRLGHPQPQLLDEEGRLMVLRAILAQRHGELNLFRATARLPGFARQLSGLLRELQRHQLTPGELLGFLPDCSPTLAAKLGDLAKLLRAYQDWLERERLHDADALLDLATAALRETVPPLRTPHSALRIPQLWLDGFAEMTPQEHDLLAAVAPFCDRATLAFCIEDQPRDEPDWLSNWSIIGRTFLRCRERLGTVPGCRVQVEVLARNARFGRFKSSAVLEHFESHWLRPAPDSAPAAGESIRAFKCADPEAEAVVAAREVLRHVQAGGRFRDCAVLARSLESHHAALRRVFTRYGIPHFMDRRESAAHHPLAELTRAALRTVAFGWRNDDWFAALKTGLGGLADEAVDELETTALARGWQGDKWLAPLPATDKTGEVCEQRRQLILPPFLGFRDALRGSPSGKQVAAAVRELWRQLDVAQELELWSKAPLDSESRTPQSALHTTVWLQLHAWLDNLDRAFADAATARPLRDWLPILEAGLGGLTVGVVPPALDQVLIGSVDRARNPNLRVVVVVGLNEGQFPATPGASPLLTETERDELDALSRRLGLSPRPRHGHERYLGYIACTRASERLVLTCATHDAMGKELNPSPLLAHAKRVLPSLELKPAPEVAWSNAVHPAELVAPLVSAEPANGVATLRNLACFEAPLAKAAQLRALATETLSPEAVVRLFGNELFTSVSALEDYAECPFRFLAARGLRAKERDELTVDVTRLGSFMHEVMECFHDATVARGFKWRDWSGDAAAAEVARIATELFTSFQDALFEQDATSAFTGALKVAQLQQLVRVLVTWAKQNAFEPAAVEVEFGRERDLPALELALDGGHKLILTGKVDRVDVCADPERGVTWAAVLDYKSSARTLDAVRVFNGLEIQLLAYLATLAAAGGAHPFGKAALRPAGVFYVPLRPDRSGASTRGEVLAQRGAVASGGFVHTGRFDVEAVRQFDTRPGVSKGEQFRFSFNQNGALSKRGNDALPSADFAALLAHVRTKLTGFGNAIFAGEFRVNPYRKGTETACDWCKYKPACRFDSWTQPFRTLALPPTPSDAAPKKGKS